MTVAYTNKKRRIRSTIGLLSIDSLEGRLYSVTSYDVRYSYRIEQPRIPRRE